MSPMVSSPLTTEHALLGFLRQRDQHEIAGAEMAAQILRQFSFGPAQISTIQGMIMATRLPQSPKTFLEEFVADADLDVLGRDDFSPRNQALRQELENYNVYFSDVDWFKNQIGFLESHTFFTEAARKIRGTGKQQNLAKMKQQLLALTQGPNTLKN